MEDCRKSKKNWTVLSRKKVYDGSPYINIFKDKIMLPDGNILNDYHRIEIRDAVILLVEDNDKRLMIYKEYRHGIGRESFTLPAGGIEDGESIENASLRELNEETGYTSTNIKKIKSFIVSGSYMFSNLHFMHIKGIERINSPLIKDIENPEIMWLSKKDVSNALKNNKFAGLTYATAIMLWLYPL